MSFMFNFSNDCISNQCDVNKDKIDWLNCEEVFAPSNVELDIVAKHARLFTCGDILISHILPNKAIENIKNEHTNLQIADKCHSDLVAGKYEGGLKIWECTQDLIEYLEKNTEQIKLQDAKILDLGCGAGILGIYALLKGSTVTFQDYNKEVLESVTIPNVMLNLEENDIKDSINKCSFYSGDWEMFHNTLHNNEKYDVILSSETIYNLDNYDKLIKLFSQRLKDDGIVLLAAKTYYFGVGGGTRQFESLINKNKLFEHKQCWKSTGGIQREIIKLELKRDSHQTN